jgi:hypothetical protein
LRATSIGSSGRLGIARMGEIVTRGKIKVDARKALHKLRDHMLVDLHLWATEIARVAVALGATWLEVDWDADDVILTFDGRALEPSAIAAVRDHVLSPRDDKSSDEKDALRLLGIGVTAALGLAPAFVDVYSAGMRLRFDAAYIDDETSPLPTPVSAERDAPKEGTRVHVRKKLGLETLGRAVKRERPFEIALLVEMTSDAPFDLRGKGISRAEAPRVPPPVLRRCCASISTSPRRRARCSRCSRHRPDGTRRACSSNVAFGSPLMRGSMRGGSTRRRSRCASSSMLGDCRRTRRGRSCAWTAIS